MNDLHKELPPYDWELRYRRPQETIDALEEDLRMSRQTAILLFFSNLSVTTAALIILFSG